SCSYFGRVQIVSGKTPTSIAVIPGVRSYLLDDELMVRYYSRVTRKGQTTIPSVLRGRFGFAEGDRVVFEETKHGLVLTRAADIEDSAGVLSRFADASEVIDHLLRERRNSFR